MSPHERSVCVSSVYAIRGMAVRSSYGAAFILHRWVRRHVKCAQQCIPVFVDPVLDSANGVLICKLDHERLLSAVGLDLQSGNLGFLRQAPQSSRCFHIDNVWLGAGLCCSCRLQHFCNTRTNGYDFALTNDRLRQSFQKLLLAQSKLGATNVCQASYFRRIANSHALSREGLKRGVVLVLLVRVQLVVKHHAIRVRIFELDGEVAIQNVIDKRAGRFLCKRAVFAV